MVPAATPVTTPPAILAVAGAALLQVPPPTLSVKVTVLLVQTVALVGERAAGVGNTVTDFVAAQPARVYKILTVPAATPVTVPDVPTVAVAGTALLQVPAGVISARDAVAPTHMETAPAGVMAAGLALTVIIWVTEHKPPVL